MLALPTHSAFRLYSRNLGDRTSKQTIADTNHIPVLWDWGGVDKQDRIGREDRGLEASEIDSCDLLSHIPLVNPYPSLNLGQSVMLYAYAFRKEIKQRNQESAAGPSEQKVLKDHAEKLLDQLKIAEKPQLIGLEMEAGGVAEATSKAAESPGFFMIRGVYDFATEGENDKWQAYACDIAGSYTIALLQRGPVSSVSTPPQLYSQDDMILVPYM